jgi:hypothetical protein
VSGSVEAVKGESSIYLVVNILSLLITVGISATLSLMIIRSAAAKILKLSDAVEESMQYFASYILAYLLRNIILFASILLLIVPFFFVFPRLLLVEYYIFDQKMDPIDAIKASWNDSKGHVSKVYGIIGVSILMALLIFTIIGIPVALYLLVMYSAAPAVLYMHLKASGQLTTVGNSKV